MFKFSDALSAVVIDGVHHAPEREPTLVQTTHLSVSTDEGRFFYRNGAWSFHRRSGRGPVRASSAPPKSCLKRFKKQREDAARFTSR